MLKMRSPTGNPLQPIDANKELYKIKTMETLKQGLKDLYEIDPPDCTLQCLVENGCFTKEDLGHMTINAWQLLWSKNNGAIPIWLLGQIEEAMAGGSSETKLLPHSRKAAEEAVCLLFDKEDAIGTFVVINEFGLGITALHNVHVENEIKESTLHVKHCKLKHVVSYPYYDISFYKLQGEGPWPFLKLGDHSLVFVHKKVWLYGFPQWDSQEEREEDDKPLCFEGVIIQTRNLICRASYQAFPGTSGGAVISGDGCLVGIHIESHYHEDHSAHRPIPFPILEDKPCKSLSLASHLPLQDFENVDPLAQYSALNVQHKGSIGAFVPIQVILQKIVEENELSTPALKRRMRGISGKGTGSKVARTCRRV